MRRALDARRPREGLGLLLRGALRALLYLFTDLLFFIWRAHEVLGGDGPRFRRDQAVDAFFFAHGFVLLLAAVAL